MSIPTICSVTQLREAVEKHHSAFPVTNTANRLVGLIPRTMLIVLGKQRAFYDQSNIEEAAKYQEEEINRLKVIEPANKNMGSEPFGLDTEDKEDSRPAKKAIKIDVGYFDKGEETEDKKEQPMHRSEPLPPAIKMDELKINNM